MTLDRCIELIKNALNEIPHLETLNYHDSEFRLWQDRISDILKATFGENSDEYKRLTPADMKIWQLQDFTGIDDQKEYLDALGKYKLALQSIIQKHEVLGSYLQSEIPPAHKAPKVFIAHGGETKALEKLKSFLDALGIELLIAEEEPSEGRSANGHIDWCLDNADCAIIPGTADDKELNDGKLYPRRNVYIEIGRVEERFPNRVIYLLEEGASFPSKH